jgi:WD40 repeat protein
MINDYMKKNGHLHSDTGSVISRRQVSTGIAGVMLTGVLYNPSGTVTTTTSPLSTTPEPHQLTFRTSSPPQYVLSDTTASIWSPDSQYLAAFHENTITLYYVHAGNGKLTYNKHQDEVLTLQWSGDSKYIASSGFDGAVHVWVAATGQTVTIYEGHTDIVRDIAWSPDQRYIASAGYDKTIQIWEALTSNPLVTYSGHRAEIQALTWSPDSRHIASTDLTNKTMIWRVMM